jgi:hypothetical protein
VGLLTHRAGTCDFSPVAWGRAAGQETRRAKWRCSVRCYRGLVKGGRFMAKKKKAKKGKKKR